MLAQTPCMSVCCQSHDAWSERSKAYVQAPRRRCLQHLHGTGLSRAFFPFGCRYLVYLTVITALAIILCQVICRSSFAAAVSSEQLASAWLHDTADRPIIAVQYVPHAPPGYHGTDIYFYSRVAVVHMAIAVALVCDIAILPW